MGLTKRKMHIILQSITACIDTDVVYTMLTTYKKKFLGINLVRLSQTAILGKSNLNFKNFTQNIYTKNHTVKHQIL